MKKYVVLIALMLAQQLLADTQVDTTDGKWVTVPGYATQITSPQLNPVVQTTDGKSVTVPGVPVDFKIYPITPYNSFQMDVYQGNSLTLPPVDILTPIPAINFNWGVNTPSPKLTSNVFALRYVGDFTFPTTGNYTFTMTVDDGGRIYLDGREILASWIPQAVKTYTVTLPIQAGVHRITHEYENVGGAAVDVVSWAPVALSAKSKLKRKSI